MDTVISAGAVLGLVVVAGVLLVRRPRHPVTVLLAVMATADLGSLLVPDLVGDLTWALRVPMLAPLLIAFPDGPRGPRWRRVFVYSLGAIVVGDLLTLVHGPVAFAVSALLGASVVPIAVAAVVSLARLWSAASGDRRTRIGLVLTAGAVLVASYLILVPVFLAARALDRGADVLEAVLEALYLGLMFSLIPLAIGVSMLLEPVGRRVGWVERLWPLAFGAAWALLVGGTAAQVCIALGASPGDPIVVAVVALLVGLSVGWVLARLTRSAVLGAEAEDRSARALRDLADRLEAVPEPDAVPALVASTVAEVLDLRGAALDALVDERYEQLAVWGDLDHPVLTRPLTHAGEGVGQLLLAPHRDGVPIDPTLLDPLLPSVAATVAATGLVRRLDLARASLREVRDDERDRLRTDLHDELSPSLAGVRLTVHAARARLAGEGPDSSGAAGRGQPPASDGAEGAPTVDGLLARADAELARAGGVIRGIIDDLRPDDLAEQGLVATLRARAADFDRPGEFDVLVEVGPSLPSLAPSVEVAVLRVGNEAICNAARHSGGRRCLVRLGGTPPAQEGAPAGVSLTVADDGRGLPGVRRAGVGLESMELRTRAAGGSLVIGRSADGGTLVNAWFPAGRPPPATPAPTDTALGRAPYRTEVVR